MLYFEKILELELLISVLVDLWHALIRSTSTDMGYATLGSMRYKRVGLNQTSI